MESKKNNCDCITSLFAGFVIVAIVAICFIVEKIDGLGNTSIVLAFIGILATFVVISNYAQMLEIRNKTKDDIEQRQHDLRIMNQKIDALTKDYGIEEIAIRELFGFNELSFVLLERLVMESYYIVTYNNETMLVVVTGYKSNTRARRCSPLEYLENYKNYDDKEKIKIKKELIRAGISSSEFE